MATTREQAESHGYDSRRQATSLIRGTDEALHDPRRRLNRALGGGVAIGVLVMAGFGIAGWLGGGSGPELPGEGAVVVSGSGDRYVVSDGVLHPALNLSSALLVGGGKRTEVRSDVLDGVRRGLPVGIPAAPDSLPGKDDLSSEDWTVCAIPEGEEGGRARTHLYVALDQAGPAPGTGTREKEPSSVTVLARSPDDELWLLADKRRYRISEQVRDALGLRRSQEVPLSGDVLATVPEGPAIRVPETAEKSQPVSGLPVEAGTGDLAHSDLDGVNPQYYQIRQDGLVPVSELVYTLLQAAGATEHELTPAQAAGAPRSQRSAPGDPAWPQQLPEAVEPGREQPVCVTTPPGSTPGDTPWEATVHLPERMPDPTDVTPVASVEGTTPGPLDKLYVPSGQGAVVRAAASAGSGGTYTLVTDSGMAYPFSSGKAVERLRYEPDDALSVPKGFVALLPSGPVLDPQSAAKEYRGGTDELEAEGTDTGGDSEEGDKSGEGDQGEEQ
ncbi:type VII secretion protein EccB [Streptomyces oceani]|uniref:Type VII secretion protein EccB n=1 Tax=Streptomyces oceani TaxID=1075402 RepID=A0A1E7JXN8_9ACTN|nr:type VII secretion protein EccB [Streptomyces oceani]OEU96380.1 hypothetical protein AN216_20465 [Streptomyces oceani]